MSLIKKEECMNNNYYNEIKNEFEISNAEELEKKEKVKKPNLFNPKSKSKSNQK